MLAEIERTIDRIDGKLDRLIDDLGDLKPRLARAADGLAGVNRRLDRLEVRVDRVEKRLEIADGPYGGVHE